MKTGLEKASWIAGIISAAIAIYAALPSQKTADSNSPSVRNEITASAPTVKKDEPPMAKSVMTLADIRIPPVCEPNVNLKESIKTAGTIYSATERDRTYASLVHDALCSNEIDLALNTASKIYVATSRDDCLYRCVEFLIHKENPHAATAFAEKIYTATVRDKAKQAIIVGMKAMKPSGGD